MRPFLLLLLFALGCASFAPRDLRPDDPAELGDLLGFGATSVRYRVMEISPNYQEENTLLTCVNEMTESRARCREGDVCYSMRRVDAGADRAQESVCMRFEYVEEVYHVEDRANRVRTTQ